MGKKELKIIRTDFVCPICGKETLDLHEQKPMIFFQVFLYICATCKYRKCETRSR